MLSNELESNSDILVISEFGDLVKNSSLKWQDGGAFGVMSNLSLTNQLLCENSTACSVNSTLATINSSDYEYDYLDSIDTLWWGELAPALFVYAATYLLGVTGNCLLVFTIARYRRLKSTTNVFLASLATADLLLILICIPVKIARLFSFSWTLGYFLCKLIYYMQAVSTTCSVYTMTAMSLERYYAIVHPMRAQYRCTIGKAKIVATVVWIMSSILASPILWAQVHMEVGDRRKAFWCVRDFDSSYLWPTYETYNLILVLVLPGVVMATAYASILNAVYNMAVSRRSMTLSRETCEPVSPRLISEDKTVRQMASGSVTSTPMRVDSSLKHGVGTTHLCSSITKRTRKKVVRMLLVVVLLFIVCWGPILVLNLLQAYNVVPMYGPILKHWRTALDLLSYCNSCMNPVVYGFMSKNFRRGFQRALCAIARKERNLSFSRSETFRKQSNRGTKEISFSYNGVSNSVRPQYGRKGCTVLDEFKSSNEEQEMIEIT